METWHQVNFGMHSGIGLVLEVTTSILAGLHCIEVMVPEKTAKFYSWVPVNRRLDLLACQILDPGERHTQQDEL